MPIKVDLRNAEATRKELAAAKKKLAKQQAQLAQLESDRDAASKAWAALNQVSYFHQDPLPLRLRVIEQRP